MTHALKWARVVGILSVLPCTYYWVGASAGLLRNIKFPYNPGAVMLSVALSVPASIWAANRWTRWMYAVTGIGIVTLVFVIGSLA
jgi:hypothetical protein